MRRHYYIFADGKLVLKENAAALPEIGIDDALNTSFIRSGLVDRGNMNGDIWAELKKDAVLPEGYSLNERRGLWPMFGETEFFHIGKAYHIADWHRTNRYCGVCSAQTFLDEKEWGMRCKECREISFPVIAPAIIVAVEREGKLLMGHGVNFPPGRFSVLAGFVEPGENLEDCVKREVFEESHICVKNVKYFGSQPWPFPRSLMVGFTAEWESGEIEVDNCEVLEARWFAPDEMPDIPQSISISRRLIDDFLRRHA